MPDIRAKTVYFRRQHALSSAGSTRAVPTVAEALLVLGHTESTLEFTGDLVRTRASPSMTAQRSSQWC